MKKNVFRILLAALVILPFFGLTGCAPTVIVDGKTYEALKPEEEQTLILSARQALLRKQNLLTPAELRLIRTTEPAFEIRYTGDRIGTAIITWKGPDRIISIKFWGAFLKMGYMASVMSIEERQPATLDLSKQQQKERTRRPAK